MREICVVTANYNKAPACLLVSADPAFPGGGERIHWDGEDPADAEARGVPGLDAFRAARDGLRRRIEEFLRER